MGVHFRPNLSKQGLILHLDAMNPRSARRFSSLIDMSSWTYNTTGTVSGYNRNGGEEENIRVLSTNPFGKSAIVWECRPGAVSDADGGWNTNFYPVDSTKTYRFSVWVRRTVHGNGSFYLGLTSSGGPAGVLNRVNGAVNTNPYFIVLGGVNDLNEWTLYVGHVHPVDSGIGSNHPDTGGYRVIGGKTYSGGSDFVWQAGTTSAHHRCYLYYSTNTDTRQQMWDPRIEVCDGTEPTIAELLANAPYLWHDLSGYGNHAEPSGNQTLRSLSNNAFVVNNPTPNFVSTLLDYECAWWEIPHTTPFVLANLQSWTISGWIKVGSSALSDNGCGWFHKGDAGIHIEPRLGGGVPSWRLNTATSWSSSETWTAPVANTFIHMVVTYDITTSTNKLYINGIERTTRTPVTISYSGGPVIWLGRRLGHFRHALKGEFGTYRVFNRALAPAEILAEYHATLGRYQ